MTCDHAGCPNPAQVKTRFGDGIVSLPGWVKRQTFVHYCGECFVGVDELFLLCDVTPLQSTMHVRQAA